MGTQYFCGKSQRRAQVLAARNASNQPVLNGIDFLEVASADQKTLTVQFLFPLPGSPNAVPPSPAPALTAGNIVIQGGVRITGVQVSSVSSSRQSAHREGERGRRFLRLHPSVGCGYQQPSRVPDASQWFRSPAFDGDLLL